MSHYARLHPYGLATTNADGNRCNELHRFNFRSQAIAWVNRDVEHRTMGLDPYTRRELARRRRRLSDPWVAEFALVTNDSIEPRDYSSHRMIAYMEES